MIRTEREFRDYLLYNPKKRYFELDPNLVLSEGFVEEFMDKLLKSIDLFDYFTPSDAFIEKHFSNQLFRNVLLHTYGHVNEDILDKFSGLLDRINWTDICVNQKLSESFIEKYENEVHWGYILVYQDLSIPFLEKWWVNKIPEKQFWDFVSGNQKLSPDFIRKNKDRINWRYIYAGLSVEIAREFSHLIDFKRLNYRKFTPTEEFVTEFGTVLDLPDCFRSVGIKGGSYSEAFIEKYLKKVSINIFFEFYPLSTDFILRHSGKFTKTSQKLILNNKRIKKDLEFYKKVGHLFQFSFVAYGEEALREIIKFNLNKFDIHKLVDEGDIDCLRQLARYLAD